MRFAEKAEGLLRSQLLSLRHGGCGARQGAESDGDCLGGHPMAQCGRDWHAQRALLHLRIGRLVTFRITLRRIVPMRFIAACKKTRGTRRTSSAGLR